MKRKAAKTPRRSTRQKSKLSSDGSEIVIFDIPPDKPRDPNVPILPIEPPEMFGKIAALLKENGHTCMMLDRCTDEPKFRWCQRDECTWVQYMQRMRALVPDKNGEVPE